MMMRNVKLAGWGNALPDRVLRFGDQTRYRLEKGQTLLDLTKPAAERALQCAGLSITDMDCIVCAMATPLQAIPCNAALVHEQLGKELDIPAMDINTTCTSFITALDLVSYMIEMDRYRNVLIVSGDAASAGLNPNQRESYELFSDAAAAFVLSKAGADEPSQILYGKQRTWSLGAHDTEIRGGGGLMPAFELTDGNREDYYFDMKGPRILKLSIKKLPDFLEDGLKEAGVSKAQIHMVIPHQASKALRMIMPKLGFPRESYIDHVSEYGNMISASIPYTLCQTIEEGRVCRGDLVLLIGTAAGLTANMLLLRF